MSRFSTNQIAQLRDIMTVLSQHRHEQALSLEEIATKTYIQLRLLKALEEHNLEILPEAVFVQGFIRKYADMVGLDGAVFATAFMSNMPIAPAQAAVSNEAVESGSTDQSVSTIGQNFDQKSIHDQSPSDSLATIQPVAATQLKPLTFSSRSRSPFSWILPIVAIGVGIVTVAIAIPKFRLASQKPVSPSPTVAVSPLPEKPPSSLAPEASMPVQVSVTLKGDSWMQVNIDGKQEFEGTLKAGTERSWSAQKKLTMQIGNAGDVLLSVNGSEAKPAGDPGEVRELTIKPTDDGSLLEKPTDSGSALDPAKASASSNF